jgi:hypothetical protein
LSEIWDKVVPLSERIETLFNKNFIRENTTEEFEGWKDMFWSSDVIRKCHLKIIDHRETRKMWLMHINIFPNTDINLPILGFDIVAGPKKVTGAFFDYSVSYKHPYSDYLEIVTKNLVWNKPRELPEWAQKIFSENMIAAGNIQGEELDQLCNVTYELVSHYITDIEKNAFPSRFDLTDWHNFYCVNQKLNPHLHRSILAMGISEEDKDRYVNEVLFEEI